MRKFNVRDFAIGIIVGGICFSGIAYADSSSQSIQVYFKHLRYFFNGQEKVSDSPGFIYNNTTYVPLRFLSESLGKKVGWETPDNDTGIIRISDNDSNNTLDSSSSSTSKVNGLLTADQAQKLVEDGLVKGLGADWQSRFKIQNATLDSQKDINYTFVVTFNGGPNDGVPALVISVDAHTGEVSIVQKYF